ncbi:MAG: hypothetical protein AAGC96_19195, partial [Pseudomonadota bacterium]
MQGIRKMSDVAILLGATLVMSACNTTAPQDQAVRTSVETAPADLQLLCAARGADQFGVGRDKVLPTSSTRETDVSYRVVLSLDGETATC